MKRILALVFVLGLVALSPSYQPVQSVEMTEVAMECHHGQCQATAKTTGKRCKHCVSNAGDRYCWQHK